MKDIYSVNPEMLESLNNKGFTILDQVINSGECKSIIDMYGEPALFRKKIVMERYRFGAGEYKYFTYPLPNIIQQLRENLYHALYPIANKWFASLNIKTQFPESHKAFTEVCRQSNQTFATPLILKYGVGGHNTLHQDLYSDVYFPLQAVVFLNKPGKDYTGGEFVMIEQIPRAQSKAVVLQPEQGDVLIFTTQFRPQKGTKGYYQINMKHCVSEVHSGERHTLGIIFHDPN
jgi:hypothetical protein